MLTPAKTWHQYLIYGLHLQSELELPELMPGGNGADVRICRGDLGGPPVEDGPIEVVEAHKNEINISLRGVGKASVKNGSEIVIEPAPGLEERNVRLFILGPVLAALLCQRNLLVLHASAVVIDGGVVGFMGRKGWGKSTMAAALHKRGYPLVSDDLLALDVSAPGPPIVDPGFPQLKLWPDSAQSIGDDPEALPRLHPDFTKRARAARTGFMLQPLPLKRLYVLNLGATPQVEAVPPHEAFLELVRHTYAKTLIGSEAIDSAAHFKQCSAVINTVPVVRLKRPVDLAVLNQIIELIEQQELSPNVTPVEAAPELNAR